MKACKGKLLLPGGSGGLGKAAWDIPVPSAPGADKGRAAGGHNMSLAVGLGQTKALGPLLPPRCRVRVIDTFGTEPAYNHEEYATLRGYRTNWGYWNLQPTQFMTMFRK